MIVAPFLHHARLDPLYLGLAVAGSLLPDLDHPKSWVGRRARPVSTAIAKVLGHRGITHSALALVGLVMVLGRAGYAPGIVSALALGYLSHLGADMLTPAGLRLAWPLRRTWGVPLCRTGSPAEPLIVLSFCVAAGWLVFHGAHVPRGWRI